MIPSNTPSKGLPSDVDWEILAAGTGGRAAVIKVSFVEQAAPEYCGGEAEVVIKIGPDKQHRELSIHEQLTGGSNIVRLLGSSRNVSNIGQLFPGEKLSTLVAAVNKKAGYALLKRDGSFSGLQPGAHISTFVMERLDGDIQNGPWRGEKTPKRQRAEADILDARRAANAQMRDKGYRDHDDRPRNWGYKEGEGGQRSFKRLDFGETRELTETDPSTPSSAQFKHCLKKCLKPARKLRKQAARALYIDD